MSGRTPPGEGAGVRAIGFRRSRVGDRLLWKLHGVVPAFRCQDLK